jgi:GNAT superfamily N-acetyltransferase
MSALRFCKADESLRPALIARMKDVLAQSDAHNAAGFDEARWRWQYERLPSRTAAVYVAVQDGEVYGYYHVPFYAGKVHGQPCTFAAIQDVAVDRSMRGRGVFRRLAEYANRELEQHGDLVYTFPNERSIHTFLKYDGYARLTTLDAYLLPLHSRRVIQAKRRLAGLEYVLGAAADAYVRRRRVPAATGLRIERLTGATAQLTSLFAQHAATWATGIERSSAYLKWRVFEAPGDPYRVFASRVDGRLTSAAVFREDEILGSDALVLMDFAFLPAQSADLLALVQHVKHNAADLFRRDPALIFAAGHSATLEHLRRIGFVRVPAALNPRPLHLLVRDVRTGAALTNAAGWHVTLSDWDVF